VFRPESVRDFKFGAEHGLNHNAYRMARGLRCTAPHHDSLTTCLCQAKRGRQVQWSEGAPPAGLTVGPHACKSAAMSVESEPPAPELLSTHWSEVKTAAVEASDGVALGALLEKYRPALAAHLSRRFPSCRRDLEDLLQDFIRVKILEEQILAQARRERGRFRAFIFTTLDRFVISRYRHGSQPARRAEFVPLEDMDDLLEDPAAGPRPDPGDQVWAKAVVAQAVHAMQEECLRKQRADLWDIFQHRLLNPTLSDEATVPYEELAKTHGLESPHDARNRLATAKEMFTRCLCAVVGLYAKGEVEQELADLRAILAGDA